MKLGCRATKSEPILSFVARHSFIISLNRPSVAKTSFQLPGQLFIPSDRDAGRRLRGRVAVHSPRADV
jgi:hypothetical protein